ncbi:MAG: GDP-mannose-dependent alpha-(1-6)-phosphatidylinositol monomannoside mannosyltransferase [bacterium ADurb.Bin429]|nr:MAG: GDP-mannose-dependent alpha-(1-6)-phosphatidylinositol monomannoside mannosyltransferase [bacterium ADurb.Bin429]
MRIGITCFAGVGGSGIVATELGIGLAAHGHTVHFICAEMPFRLDDLSEHLFFHQVHLFPYPVLQNPQYDLALASRLSEVIAEQELDLLHVHYAVPHAISAFLARQICARAFRVVTTVHGTDTRLVGLDPSYRPITRFGLEQSDGVTAVSHYLAEATRDDFTLTRPIAVLPNFVDTQRFRRRALPPCYRENFAHPGERLLIHVSNMRPVKRIADIVRAFALIQRRIPSRLVLVGDGPDRLIAERLACDLEIADRITFTGNLAHVENVLAVGDLFLLASEVESFGLAALEAMACGMPVVAYRVGGVPEVVDDGVSGLLVPLYDFQALAESAIELLSAPARLTAFGTAARAAAETQFAHETGITAYEHYYTRMLTGAPAHADAP